MPPQIFFKFVILPLLILVNITKAQDIEVQPLLECAKLIINNGVMELGIPPFSEISLPEIPPIIIEDLLLKGTYIVEDANLKGLSDFDMTSITLNIIPDGIEIKYNFTLHGIRLTTKYDFDGRIVDVIDIKGKGDLDITLQVDLSGTILLGYDSELHKFQMYPAVKPTILIWGLSIGERMSKLAGRQLDAIVISAVELDIFQFLFNISANFLVELIREIDFDPEILKIILGKCNLEESESFMHSISERISNKEKNRADL